MSHQRYATFVVMTVLMGAPLGSLAAVSGDSTMVEHMRIQTSLTSEKELGELPSITIDRVHAEVPLDDRLNADAAFSRPFTESLQHGMGWYLKQRGVRVQSESSDLRIAATIEYYEGSKGWGSWGVDVRLKVKAFRGSDLILTDSLRSFLIYSDDYDVIAEEKPKYPAGQRPTFIEVLFTRVGIDLSEKLITLFKENTLALSGRSSTAAAATIARGTLTIETTVPNAEVFLEGKLLGTAPLADLHLPTGTHAIEVRKKGFRTWKRDVTILEGLASRITAELEAEDAPR